MMISSLSIATLVANVPSQLLFAHEVRQPPSPVILEEEQAEAVEAVHPSQWVRNRPTANHEHGPTSTTQRGQSGVLMLTHSQRKKRENHLQQLSPIVGILLLHNRSGISSPLVLVQQVPL
ncbi:hypothetical protein M440DRAFT_315479 [Trichoderma longibrachiatum ATCC 18648]|uniref:Uncharacterized protein n=1 Tax=Trichoderma longibrachiatum ATCC 18648 TaxID=983965 RepID=A0A2T4C3P4_TRILO|nr:hypothetical protein M440DRAFT_315479 [Trichoderma longibrachiatum ATCC 18648]